MRYIGIHRIASPPTCFCGNPILLYTLLNDKLVVSEFYEARIACCTKFSNQTITASCVLCSKKFFLLHKTWPARLVARYIKCHTCTVNELEIYCL